MKMSLVKLLDTVSFSNLSEENLLSRILNMYADIFTNEHYFYAIKIGQLNGLVKILTVIFLLGDIHN